MERMAMLREPESVEGSMRYRGGILCPKKMKFHEIDMVERRGCAGTTSTQQPSS